MSSLAEIFKVIVAKCAFASGGTVGAGEFTDVDRDVFVCESFFQAFENVGKTFFIYIVCGIFAFGCSVAPFGEVCPVTAFVIEFHAEFAGRVAVDRDEQTSCRGVFWQFEMLNKFPASGIAGDSEIACGVFASGGAHGV